MALILVVDDLDLMREICARTLETAGYTVIQAANGIEAVKLYRAEHPDAVLLDVSMPGQDGLETLGQIRAFDAKARVAMLTSYKEEEMVRRAISLGARDYVAKPFQRDRLLESVRKLVGP